MDNHSATAVAEAPLAGQVAGWFSEEWAGEGSGISFRVRSKLADVQSEFQRIEVFETERFGTLLTLDGLVMVTSRDNFLYHEMLVHPALYAHPAPRDVLIIGGGDCGSLQQVLRHPEVERVTQVEIDEQVTRVCERFFPELCADNGDPRATLHFKDGIDWVRSAAPGSYDVILVDGSDPLGPAAVLFAEEFYAACFAALRPGGILAGQTESPLFHLDLLTHVHRTAQAVGFADCQTLFFPQCVYPSGWWTASLARKGEPLELPPSSRFGEMPVMQYYTPQVHQAAFAAPAFFLRALRAAGLGPTGAAGQA